MSTPTEAINKALSILNGPAGHADCPPSECPAKRLADAIAKALEEAA